jgi:hypothetical protein
MLTRSVSVQKSGRVRDFAGFLNCLSGPAAVASARHASNATAWPGKAMLFV